jgi:hypothetical protein
MSSLSVGGEKHQSGRMKLTILAIVAKPFVQSYMPLRSRIVSVLVEKYPCNVLVNRKILNRLKNKKKDRSSYSRLNFACQTLAVSRKPCLLIFGGVFGRVLRSLK